MRKEIVKNLNPSIVDMLPRGAVKELAEEFEINRANMSKILKGEFGDDRHFSQIIEAALKKIKSHATTRNDFVKKVCLELNIELHISQPASI